MASSTSPYVRGEQQATGENLNAWGGKLNAYIQRVEEAVANTTVIALGVATSYDLTTPPRTANWIADESRSACLQVTGTPASAVAITTPDTKKIYLVDNQTAKSLTFARSGGGASATVRAGCLAWLYCDGVRWRVSDLTLDQILAAAADVSLNNHKLTDVADPVADQDATTKAWVLARKPTDLTLITSSFNFNNQKGVNVATPTANGDAVNKSYADGLSYGATLPSGSIAGQIPYWNGSANNLTAGAILNAAGTLVLPAALGTGTPDATTVLRGDGVWAAPTGVPDYLLQAQGII